MSLDGTKTHENLKEAFAGESQANRRYLWFAQKADVEGYPDTAAMFRSVAEGETGHAHGHLEYLAEATGRLQDLASHTRTTIDGVPRAMDRSLSTDVSVSLTSGLARILRDQGHLDWVWPIVGAVAVIVLGYAAWMYRRYRVALLAWPDRHVQREQPWRALVGLEWTLLMAFMLVFNPQTNSRHWILLLTLDVLMVVLLLQPRRKAARFLILVGALLMLGGLTLPPGSHANTSLLHATQAWAYWGGPSWVILLSLIAILWGGLSYIRDLVAFISQSDTGSPSCGQITPFPPPPAMPRSPLPDRTRKAS